MSNGNYIDEIIALADKSDELSVTAIRRLTLTLVKENYKQAAAINSYVKQLDQRLELVEDHLKTYPSVLWLLKNRTKPTVVVFTTIVAVVAAFGPFLLRWGINTLLMYMGLPSLEF